MPDEAGRRSDLHDLAIDREYLRGTLERLLTIPSPTGMTDAVVGWMCKELERLGLEPDVTRRGAIRVNLPGEQPSPDRAVAGHLDTLGAMVKDVRPDGMVGLLPVGHWSARFAEGARCTVFTDDATRIRGTILPPLASGHTFNEKVDEAPIGWDHVQLRLDEEVSKPEDVFALGIHIGDMVAIDPLPEFLDNGFINARHLDDKAGVAAILAALKALIQNGTSLPMDCHFLFTISEEVGVGASHVMHGDIAELLAIDNGTIAPGQYTSAMGVTLAMMDSAGPFDWHLTRQLLGLCRDHGIEHARDVFRYYRSDSASAVEAGNDIRTALACFGLDASHGYERTQIRSLEALARLIVLYVQCPPLFERDHTMLGPVDDLPPGDSGDFRRY